MSEEKLTQEEFNDRVGFMHRAIAAVAMEKAEMDSRIAFLIGMKSQGKDVKESEITFCTERLTRLGKEWRRLLAEQQELICGKRPDPMDKVVALLERIETAYKRGEPSGTCAKYAREALDLIKKCEE